MCAYKQILVAIDFTEDSRPVCQKALEIAEGNHGRISLVHVVEFFYQMSSAYDPMFYPSFEGLGLDEEELTKMAREQMAELIKALEVKEDIILDSEVVTGSPKTEILRLAEEKNVDLIVCGSHGRSGLELLLGSTANAILHHAFCDVLAVRTGKQK